MIERTDGDIHNQNKTNNYLHRFPYSGGALCPAILNVWYVHCEGKDHAQKSDIL